MDRVSVIIPVYNGAVFLNALVDSIITNTKHKDYEVIIVDDKSEKDDMAKIYKKIEKLDNFRIIYNKENLGFAKTNNVGFKYATGEFIYLLNSDTIVKEGWLFEAVKMFRKSKLFFGNIKIGAIQSKLILPPEGDVRDEDVVQTCGSVFNNEGWPVYNYHKYLATSQEANTISIVHSFMGCGVLIKKSLIDEVNGFDEEFGKYYFEDTDLSLRISELGYKVAYNPESEILHFHGMSTSVYVEDRSEFDLNVNKGKSLFREKWPLEKIVEALEK